MSRGERRRWIAKVRANPKGALEADLVLAVIGLIVAAMGSLISVAGIHPAWQNIHSNAAAPILGSVIFTAGLYVTAIGLVLMTTNVVVWVSGRRRTLAPEPEVNLVREKVVDCDICGECKPLGRNVLAAVGICAVAVAIGGAAAAIGGSCAIILGGLALLVFVVGAWSLVIMGGLLLLVHWTGRGNRKSARRRRDLRSRSLRTHHRR